jgi:two-component system sensor histidine kinase KdpD
MADMAVDKTPSFAASGGGEQGADAAQPASRVTAYAVALLLVAVASVLAFVVQHLIAAPNLTLIYVLPVVIAATAFGWGPALTAAITGVLAFDFFFTAPYFSFRIYSPNDIWAAALLLATAAIVASVAAQGRRRAVEARTAASQAEALHTLAQVVIQARPQPEILQAAATALRRIFRAPAVIYVQDAGGFHPAATAGEPRISALDEEAARGAMAAQLHTRAEAYPFDQAEFEFWPVLTPGGSRCVIGVDFTHAEVERPVKPERFTDAVAAYLAAALQPGAASGRVTPLRDGSHRTH